MTVHLSLQSNSASKQKVISFTFIVKELVFEFLNKFSEVKGVGLKC